MDRLAPLDTSFLPAADFAFIVMTDTHHMLDPGPERVEFESRRRQSARAAAALKVIGSLDVAFVVHLGDLVQEFPEGPGFEESLSLALRQFDAAEVMVRQVAGNHDVGDKPDPTMPTEWVTEATLAAYHDRFGPSWTSWDEARCHFVILNSQILNGPLSAVAEQREWLEADLAAHGGMPTFIFQHLSPFLVDSDEPGLGHYDNIDEPARSWLLDLVRNHNVQMVFAGHSHFSFFNRIGAARSYLVPSTAFTRPGFCEVFSSAPPPERGRDDAAKLGFFLVTVHDQKPRVHLVRTGGAKAAWQDEDDTRRIVTGVTADLPTSPLGMTLRHPLSFRTEVPIAWQSTVRQPVRNDYPLLACLELGLRYLRVPASDTRDAEQRARLSVLRDEGMEITAFWSWSPNLDLFAEVSACRDLLGGVEVQLPDALVPDDACFEGIGRIRNELALPVSIAPLLPHEHIPGKQHARTRIGYHLDELRLLEEALDARQFRIDRVLCRLDAMQEPATIQQTSDQTGHYRWIDQVDWAVEFQEGDPSTQIPRAVGALAAVAGLPGSRLFLEPLIDLDRTMDAPPGLLNRLCNPNPVFHAVRTLNTVLFHRGGSWTSSQAPQINGAFAYSLENDQEQLLITLPGSESDADKPLHLDTSIWPRAGYELTQVITLSDGLSRATALDDDGMMMLPTEPSILIARLQADA